MSELAKALSQRVRALRTARNMTQVALGEASGISEEWIRRIERGEGAPSFDVIEAMAKALGVGAAELFDRTRTPGVEQLLARAEKLDAAELDWVLKLLDLVQSRPGRRKRSAS